ncbi:MAG: UDP-N-acetylmuramoyl-L-alanine--D-glutamate ligase, partial [Oscillospiraceae bacterium]|nr:UDP-N-acetylmuramoyl-L-alanine--D-glutamate ligase [Oscillospiraceae bacterium]
HVKRLYLNGATAQQIKDATLQAENYAPGAPEIVDCGDFETAVLAAAKDAKAGDVVLMSPASAAFDQFKKFMVRGQVFKKLIMEL